MIQGICFYLNFHKPIPLLVTCLHSLLKHYDGRICIIAGDKVPRPFLTRLMDEERFDILMTRTFHRDPVFVKRKKGANLCWMTKPFLHKESPYEISVFYDCDHVFRADVTDYIFDKVRDDDLTSFHFTGDTRARRSRKMPHVMRVMHGRYGIPMIQGMESVNGGCVGSRRSSPLIDEWIELMLKISEGNKTRRWITDEYSLSYLIRSHRLRPGSSLWSLSINEKTHKVPGKEAWLVGLKDKYFKRPVIALHFNQRGYIKSPTFQAAVVSAINDDYMGIASSNKEYE